MCPNCGLLTLVSHLNIMNHFAIDLLTWAFTHSPEAAIAILNRENDPPYVAACFAGIIRQRSRSDLAWLWKSLPSILASGIDPGTIQAGPVTFPPHGMSWTAYAACLEDAADAFHGYRPIAGINPPDAAECEPVALRLAMADAGPSLMDLPPSVPAQSGQSPDLDEMLGLTPDAQTPPVKIKKARRNKSPGRGIESGGGLF